MGGGGGGRWGIEGCVADVSVAWIVNGDTGIDGIEGESGLVGGIRSDRLVVYRLGRARLMAERLRFGELSSTGVWAVIVAVVAVSEDTELGSVSEEKAVDALDWLCCDGTAVGEPRGDLISSNSRS